MDSLKRDQRVLVYLTSSEMAELEQYCDDRLGMSKSVMGRIAIMEVVRSGRPKVIKRGER